MARQFKIEVNYVNFNAELYWHDNDTIEFVTVPQTLGAELIGNRAVLLEQIINFMKLQGVNEVIVTRL